MRQAIKETLIKIKQEKPFVLHITNYFAIDLIASGLRSIGAYPFMSNAEHEIEDLFTIAKAVVINLGKLDDDFIALCNRICKIANNVNKPVILDPVGAGATRYRTDTALSILKKHKISVVRAYPNEVIGLLNKQAIMPNDTSIPNKVVIEEATALSEKYKTVFAVTGAVNSIIDSNKRIEHYNFDSSLLHKVAGIGSLLSSIIGAFHTTETDSFQAAAAAVEFYGICVGNANSSAIGPASLRDKLIDNLYIQSTEAVHWGS